MAGGYHKKQGRSRHTGSPQHLLALFLAEESLPCSLLSWIWSSSKLHLNSVSDQFLRMSAGDAPAPTRGDISSVVAVTGQRQGAFSERASQVALVVKDPPANAGDKTDVGSVPGSGRSPGGGHSNPLQYCCLDSLMDSGVWWTSVHRVSKSQTQLKRLNMHVYMQTRIPLSSLEC